MNIDLALITRAIDYYNCIQLSVPYLVDPDIMEFTCPPGAVDKRLQHFNGKQYVASAEQSFLQLEKDGRVFHDDYQYIALTPCYRDEWILDETHYNIFLKLEIFHYNPTLPNGDYLWADAMRNFLQQEGLPVELKPTDLGYDIMDLSGLELGSFGYRTTPKGVPYVYGTGLAEPRASLAFERCAKRRLEWR